MLTVQQQSVAVLAYVKAQIAESPNHAVILEDKAFVDRLDMNFVTVSASKLMPKIVLKNAEQWF